MPDTLISVRGRASELVPPDAAELRVALSATDADKRTALGLVGTGQRELTARLGELGGVVRGTGTSRAALSWSAESLRTVPEWHPTEGHDTGRTVASLSVHVTVRDFALLDPLGDALAAVDIGQLQWVDWSVDDDNAAWPRVRAAAVEEAVGKARDYAAALGGRVVAIEHLADSGLLGGGDVAGGPVMFARATAGGGDDGPPSLDPVPQELVATVEARVRADVPALG